MSDQNDQTPDELIKQLCGDLHAVKPRSPYPKMFGWLFGALIYLVGVVAFIGLRPDFDMRAMNLVYIFEIGIAFFILISAALASAWLSFPDCYQHHWVKIIPLSLSVIFAIWCAVRSIEEGVTPHFHLHLEHCAHEGLMMEVIPLAALILLTMKGRTTQPYWSMTMDVLAVSSLGWIGLRLTCPMDDMGHSLFNHLLPFAIVAVAIGFFARKLFKW